MPREILIATHNQHKKEEIQQILGNDFSVTSLADYDLHDEIVEDGKTGFICSPFDSDDLKNSIKKVCSLSDAEYKAMSSCAVEKAKIEFSPVTYAQKLTQKYNEIINNHKKKG